MTARPDSTGRCARLWAWALSLLTLAALAACSKPAPSADAPAGAQAPAIASSAAAPVQPVYREIRQWILACDNTRNCVAKFVPDEASAPTTDGGVVGLSIVREGGAAGKLAVTLGAEAAFDPADLRLDGKALPPGAGWRRADKDQSASLEDDAAQAFIRRIRDGAVLALSGAADAPNASLKGLAAVLLAMDEAQGRIGNASALIKTGPAPASATPAPPPPPPVVAASAPKPLTNGPQLIAAVRRSQAAALMSHDCDASATGEDAAEPLNADEAVVVVECEMAAYQSSVLAFRVPRGAPEQARLLVLPAPPVGKPDPRSAGEYVEGSFDPATATFSESAKGRGIADCGQSTGWVFDGRDFHLSSFAYQERCGGEPGDWPVLYRSRTQPAR